MKLAETRYASLRFLVPVALVGAAHTLTHAMGPLLQYNLSLLFITAVMISALYGGMWPGLLASGLAALASAFFHLPPARSLDIDYDDFLRLALFVSVALVISGLSAARRRTEDELREARDLLERRVHERTAELRVANEELQQEIAERKQAEGKILAYQLRLQSLASELSVTEERERRRIATALHDAIGHALAVSVMRLQSLPEEELPERIARALKEIRALIERAIQHTRSLTLQLSPPILYELGLGPAVEWLGEQFEREHGLSIRVSDEGQLDGIDEQVRSLLFSAIRELLVNAIKHAQAREARVEIGREGDYARVVVQDDGVGFDSQRLRIPGATSGFGLFHIRERLAHLGGHLEVESAPGRGCRLKLRVPVAMEHAEA